ncbi:MAG TPA: peptidase S41, partial [Burkholderiales bacterium]|nr:peptidase S41 [Burkholderiales bacterium]
READLQRHLENSLAKGEPAARAKPVPQVVPGEQKPVELGSKDDFQLSQALAFLKGEPVKSQSPTVAQNKPETN